MENQVIEAVLIEEEIERLKGEIAEIINTIERLKATEYDFLHKMYVQHLSMKTICTTMRKSYSWAKAVHNRALKNLQRILDGFWNIKLRFKKQGKRCTEIAYL